MKVLISSTEYSVIIDLEETTLEEWMMCLESQYPLGIDNMEEDLSDFHGERQAVHTFPNKLTKAFKEIKEIKEIS